MSNTYYKIITVSEMYMDITANSTFKIGYIIICNFINWLPVVILKLVPDYIYK